MLADAGLGLKELSHSLLRHASGLAQSSEIPAHVDAAREPSDPTARARHRAHTYGLSNSQGALCWRNDCEECMRITLACTKTAESLSVVANLYEANVCLAMLFQKFEGTRLTFEMVRQRRYFCLRKSCLLSCRSRISDTR